MVLVRSWIKNSYKAMKSQKFQIFGQFGSKNSHFHKNAIFSKTRFNLPRDNFNFTKISAKLAKKRKQMINSKKWNNNFLDIIERYNLAKFHVSSTCSCLSVNSNVFLEKILFSWKWSFFEILGQFRSKNGLFHKNAIFSKIRFGVARDNCKC